MQPLATIDYEFTDDLVEAASVSYARAMSAMKPVEYPKQLPQVVGLLAAAGGAGAWLIHEGVPLWTLVVPAILAVPVVLIVVLWGLVYLLGASTGPTRALLFRLTRWRMRRAVRGHDDRRIRWLFTEENFEVQSAVQYRSVPWHDLTHLWIGPDFWFLRLRGVAVRLLLPAAVLPDVARELFERKATQVGAKILRQDGDG